MALREGISTGSCAAAAAKAAAILAQTGKCPAYVSVVTPQGRVLTLEPFCFADGSCGVVKDAGDDRDITNGATVRVSVEVCDTEGPVTFAAGEGVGTVTLPGLKVPPKEPAVNPAPRKMITDALREVIGDRMAKVIISVPGGEQIAKKTFNPRLGVTGGISILGTSGIVKPMNEEAIWDSLTLELNTHAAAGRGLVALVFGRTGEDIFRKAWDIHGRCVVQTGNYLGYVLDEAARLKFKKVLLCGHPGKLLKVASGTFNTHNRTGDGRLEALCTQAAIAGASAEQVERLYNCRTTENAMKLVNEYLLDEVWTVLADITAKRCSDRSFGALQAEAAYLDNEAQILGCSKGALKFAEELKNEK
jgi:cobalt-precorrin-5B (C1)-methyltransferase